MMMNVPEASCMCAVCYPQFGSILCIVCSRKGGLKAWADDVKCRGRPSFFFT
ncbi:Uncharacterized protein APZ42_034469 [Daphnia magna]|uniref:Uncharacterized protein n=1 Tax=Daphnia magna TaxID=35525 RepID=A0A164K724_9CRUS|nr:Uncharacterized protein APZ42_034469 [Daphnia magna]